MQYCPPVLLALGERRPDEWPASKRVYGDNMSEYMVKYLEGMGSDASVSFLTREQYAAMVGAMDLSGPERTALLGRDVHSINDLLGGRSQMVCAIFAPEESPLKEGEDGDGQENGEERPDEDALN